MRRAIGFAAAAGLASSAAHADYYSFGGAGKGGRAAVDQYAACVIKRDPVAARAVLRNPFGGIALQPQYKRLVVPKCLHASTQKIDILAFPGDSFKYALAEAMLRLDFRDRSLPDFSAVPKLVAPEVARLDDAKVPKDKAGAATYQWALNANETNRYVTLYGECVARSAPALAARLLSTDIGSADERDAFASLQPALSGCVKDGEKLAFGRAALRGTIAFNLYRLIDAATPSGLHPNGTPDA